MREGELNELLKDPIYALEVKIAGKDMEIDELRDEIKRLREALEFYADIKLWNAVCLINYGKVARQALEVEGGQ